ncbi:MAG: molybdenum cofactor biosynthesis protein MoaE [Deltaproteobacteria bacterium]|nr:molybdenum cofactor biosynthesis protein MoaE [Deltaproteobacteria bacterium]MBN2844602.1 molybdenum cofactor biosynthesis protein MoaE [Deltaproteobacteria bacterium]
MDLMKMMEKMRANPEFQSAGMVLIHNGVARNTSRDGKPVNELTVKADREMLKEVVSLAKKRTGIIDVLAEVNEGTLRPGDDVMLVAVAGDFRENVFPALMDTVDEIKRKVTKKEER